MLESGTFSFSDRENFQAYLRRAGIRLELTVCGDFKARLTCVELPNLRLLSSRENQARSAYVSLVPERVFITFAAQPVRPLLWDGLNLQPGDVVFHTQGEQMHQRTTGACHWVSISQPPKHLTACGKALTGNDLLPPPFGQLLRLTPSAIANLQRLHASACRLVEAKPGLIEHWEVARSLEQELIYALVNCLTVGARHQHLAPRPRHIDIMRQFEGTLAMQTECPQRIPELCEMIGVPERTLRMCCDRFVGMGPSRYMRLRRLMMARAAMRHADPSMTSVSDIARRHGFLQPGRFATQYRTAFGETPSTTLRHTSSGSL